MVDHYCGLTGAHCVHFGAIMQNMIFDSVFEVDSVLENKSDFLIVADSILNKRI